MDMLDVMSLEQYFFEDHSNSYLKRYRVFFDNGYGASIIHGWILRS